MDELKTLYQTMARYNQTMNGQLYISCSLLSDEERRRDRGAWFRSIHATLNHLLLTDKVWLGRFEGQPFAAPSLDFELFETWEELRAEREVFDAKIIAWIDALEASRLRESLSFQPMSQPQPMTLPMWLAVSHLWNHQTHHRGQATAMMNAAGADSGPTDLPRLAAVQQFVGEHPI